MSLSMYNSQLKEKGLIKELFFGEQIVKMSYPLQDKIFEKEEEEVFNIVFLDVKLKEIYQAWDHSIFHSIEDYKNDRVKIARIFFIL